MQIDRQTRSVAAVFLLFAAIFMTSENVVDAAPVRRWGVPLLLYFIGGLLLFWNWLESRPASPSAESGRSDSASRAMTVREYTPAREVRPPSAPVIEHTAQVAPQTEAPPPPAKKTLSQAQPAAEVPPPVAEHAQPAAEPPAEAAKPAPKSRKKAKPDGDDLTVIEGIGPKISDALRKAGITTYAALAAAPEARIREILDGSGLRIVGSVSSSVPTWAHQASLAAAENWTELETWKAEHKLGKG